MENPEATRLLKTRRLHPVTGGELQKFFLILVIGWAAAVALTLVAGLVGYRAYRWNITKEQAREHIGNDMRYRLWVASLGGVYARITESTPPNPHLSHVMERDITTPAGQELTLINPAYMLRLVKKHPDIHTHLTSLHPIRPGNSPEEWERIALESFEVDQSDFITEYKENGVSGLRMMRPMVMEQGCLSCHGQQGSRIGDVRGGLSISIPLVPANPYILSGMVGGHFLLWLVGMVGIVKGTRLERHANLLARFPQENPFPVMHISVDGVLIYANPASAALLAAWGGVEIGGHIPEEWRMRAKETLDSRQIQHAEIEFGDTIFHLWLTPVANSGFVNLYGVDVTDQKQAEQAAIQVRQELQNIVSNTPDFMFRMDPDGNYLHVNEVAESMTGFAQDALIGMNMRQMVVPECTEILECRLKGYIEGDPEEERFNIEIFQKDGCRLWLEIKTTGIYDVEGRLEAVQGVARDISGRKQVENHLQLATQAARVGIWDWNVVEDKMFWDDTMHGPSGASPRNFTGNYESWTRLLHPEDLSMVDQALKDAMNGTHDFYEEFRVVKPEDGSIHHVSAIANVQRNASGDVVRIVGTHRDICEEKKMATERQLLATAINQSAEVVVIADNKGIVEYVNPAFEEVSGYSREEVLGGNTCFLKSDLQDERFYEKIWDRISSGHTWKGRLWNRRKDGAVYVEDATISPVQSMDGTIERYVSVKRDITRDLRLEEEYHHAQKLDAMGHLAGGIAHEFNNILQTVLGFSEMLLMEIKEPERARQDLMEIKNITSSAAHLTRQLLTFSRKERAVFTRVDLNKIVENQEKMLRPLLGENFLLVSSPTPGLDLVNASFGQMEQVLINLVLNARDAMPKGGRIIVGTENISADNAAEIPELLPGEYACLSVADSGKGINCEIREHIFEPFFTTKSPHQGTGLGLAVVYSIVQQHGGWIKVESNVGQGSVFRVYLPVCRDEESIEKTVDESHEFYNTSGQENGRILLIEDDPGIRKLTAIILRSEGYEVMDSANAEQAMMIYNKEGGRFDLLFSDVVLPEQDGIDFAISLRKEHPNLAVVLFSGYGLDNPKLEAIEKNGFLLMEKPFQKTTLLSTICSALKRSGTTGPMK